MLFQQLMHAIRVSLASAITELFLVGAVAMVLALLATFFLREIPLRKGNKAAGTPQGAPAGAVSSGAAR